MAEILIGSNPKALSPDVYRSMLKNFLVEMHCGLIESILLKSSGPEEHIGVPVSALDLIAFDSALAFNVLHYPGLLLPIFDEAVLESQRLLLNHRYVFEKKRSVPTLKRNCHVRIQQIPPIRQLSKLNIGQIRSFEVDKMIQICGTIVRTGSVRMLHIFKEYECLNRRCGFRFRVCADPEQGYALPQPRNCPGKITRREGGNEVVAKCNCSNLREVEGSGEVIDYQEIKVQDQIQRVTVDSAHSRPPRSILCILEADLVDSFNPGDDVVIVGTVVRRWRPLFAGSRCQVQCALRANSVVKCHAMNRTLSSSPFTAQSFEQYWDHNRVGLRPEMGSLLARNRIVAAVCPQLHGMFYMKLCLLLTLIGGSTAAVMGNAPNRRRRDSHLLIVGDPGTGKSQLLRFASVMLPRAVLTTGVGTTGAGLTCSTVRNGGEWVVEAGALVLANEGVCCIDEFSCMKEQDRATIHEAMEQQTLSVAKAGLVVKLNTRCSVVAVTNPKGTYDVTADLVTNTAIAGPLLSRFDLVLVLLDRPQKEWDKKISTYLLQQSCKRGDVRENCSADRSGGEMLLGGSAWDVNALRTYLLHVRERIQPVIAKSARQLLMRYYQSQRQSDDNQAARVTVRLLESLMRLAEAHAKLMHRQAVLLEDAVVAIHCMELSSSSGRYSDTHSQSTLYDDFPVDPEQEYVAMEKRVFASLNCSRETLLREVGGQHIHDIKEVALPGDIATGTGNLKRKAADVCDHDSDAATLRDVKSCGTMNSAACTEEREWQGERIVSNVRGLAFGRSITPPALIGHNSSHTADDEVKVWIQQSNDSEESSPPKQTLQPIVTNTGAGPSPPNGESSAGIWSSAVNISHIGNLLSSNLEGNDDLTW